MQIVRYCCCCCCRHAGISNKILKHCVSAGHAMPAGSTNGALSGRDSFATHKGHQKQACSLGTACSSSLRRIRPHDTGGPTKSEREVQANKQILLNTHTHAHTRTFLHPRRDSCCCCILSCSAPVCNAAARDDLGGRVARHFSSPPLQACLQHELYFYVEIKALASLLVFCIFCRPNKRQTTRTGSPHTQPTFLGSQRLWLESHRTAA